jgi:hypothetical protein
MTIPTYTPATEATDPGLVLTPHEAGPATHAGDLTGCWREGPRPGRVLPG